MGAWQYFLENIGSPFYQMCLYIEIVGGFITSTEWTVWAAKVTDVQAKGQGGTEIQKKENSRRRDWRS